MTTINLPAAFAVSKGPRNGDWSAVCDIDPAKVPEALWTELALHGLKQKIADAASSAKTEAEASAAMDKARDALYAGEWRRTSKAGEAVDPVTAEARIIIRQAMKDSLNKGGKKGAPTKEWAAFLGLSDDDQLAKIDANIEANRAAIWPLAEAEAKRKADARKAKAALKVAFKL